jgi:hypothetical protein
MPGPPGMSLQPVLRPPAKNRSAGELFRTPASGGAECHRQPIQFSPRAVRPESGGPDDLVPHTTSPTAGSPRDVKSVDVRTLDRAADRSSCVPSLSGGFRARRSVGPGSCRSRARNSRPESTVSSPGRSRLCHGSLMQAPAWRGLAWRNRRHCDWSCSSKITNGEDSMPDLPVERFSKCGRIRTSSASGPPGTVPFPGAAGRGPIQVSREAVAIVRQTFPRSSSSRVDNEWGNRTPRGQSGAAASPHSRGLFLSAWQRIT